MVSRRALLLGGLGAAALAVSGTAFAVEENVVPGRIRLAELTGRCEIDATPAASRPGVVTSGSFASSARRRTVGWSVATPPGIALDGLPVALVLHGRSEDHTAPFAHLRLQDFLAASVLGSGRPFALASIDGGDTYWHPRRDGDDPIAMLDDEYLPLLGSLGLRTDGIAVMGWSMGGYGALLLARQSHRQRLKTHIVAAAAASPALFASYRHSAAGAFDDDADFATFGALATEPDVGTTPLYVSCGTDDAFATETKLYRMNVSPTPAGAIGRGCHTAGYWRSIAAEQIRFLAAHLG